MKNTSSTRCLAVASLVLATLATVLTPACAADRESVTAPNPPAPAVPAKVQPPKSWILSGPMGESPPRVYERLPLSDQANRAGWTPLESLWDEFAGPVLDTNKWTVGLSWWRGRQPAWFNPTNVTVDNGQLHLTMRKEPAPPELAQHGYREYSSAALHSQRRCGYGYYEIRARPMDSGGSSSFWFQNEDRQTQPEWATEIDVFELCGKSPVFERKYPMNLHVFRTPQEQKHWSVGGEWTAPWRFADRFHVYGLEWGREELRWFVDGVLVRTVENTHWHQPLYLIFDSETMPEWFGMPHDADLPSTFSIEYLRAWTRPADGTPAPQPMASVARPAFLLACEGAKRILEFDAAGRLVWEYPAEMAREAWRLPSGNTLFAFNEQYAVLPERETLSGVREVTRDKQVVFEYRCPGHVFSCQRLADGNTLVALAGQGRIQVVNPLGHVVREFAVKSPPGHGCMRNARQLEDGQVLVAEEGARAVREYTPEGTLRREFPVPFLPYSAVRTPTGDTLVCGQQDMVRFDAAGKRVWELHGQDLPEMGVRWFSGIQLLPDGLIFVSNAGGKIPLFIVNQDKHVVWQSEADAKMYPTGHGIQVLNQPWPPQK